LLIDEKEGEWISLQSARSRLAVTTSVTINNNGELIGDLKINRDGIAASNGRSTIKSKGEKDYVKDLFSGKSWEIKESSYKNLETDALPLEESHAITINDHLQDAGDRIYLNPLIYGIQEENPFKSEIREYPVDFGAGFEDIIISKITIPPGYEVEELPASKALALPAGAGRFVYSSNKSGDMISITCQLIMSKTSFLPEDYPALREFYTQVVAKQTEQLVLKKK
jgi:hypothetical protein